MGETNMGLGRTWTVWGDGPEPISQDMTFDEAKEEVDRLTKQGRDDVYADDTDTGEEYTG